MSDIELLPCRQCGGGAKSNTYDVSIECSACGYEEETAETWNADRPITLEQAKKVVDAAGMVCVPIGHLQCVQNQLSSAKDAVEGAEGWVDDFVAKYDAAQERGND
jgi:hypothetical protein